MKHDKFTSAYICTLLWSGIGYQYTECPCCGKMAVLDKLPEKEYEQTPMCGADGCGVTEAQPEPLDQWYSEKDFAPATLEKIAADCERFQAENGETIQAAIDNGEIKFGPDFDEWGRAGHDFLLTRQGHGAGFWDGGWPEPMAGKLTQAAKAFGNVDFYVGNDGMIYC